MADLTLDDIAWIRTCIRNDDPLGNLRLSRALAESLLDLAEEALRAREARAVRDRAEASVPTFRTARTMDDLKPKP